MPKKKGLFKIFIVLGFVAVLAYLIVRTTLFLFADYKPLEKTFAIALMMGEGFVLIHMIGYILNMGRVLISSFGEKEEVPERLHEEPSVAVLVAARHEPKEVLRETFGALKQLAYRNKTIYFLDDSSDEKYKKEAGELCEEFGLKLFRRALRHGAKAGIVNDCLKTLDQKYVALFDADQTPLPQFLNILVAKLEADSGLAFVQTPQFYSNIEESRVARGAGFQQSVFYEYICEGKSTSEAMFCCGTNIVFRQEALLEVGGLDESTVTEDFATSVKLHVKGWRSLYYSHVYVFGMGPESLAAYFKQQFRWAAGTITVFKQLIGTFFRRPSALRIVQWWEYFLSGSYYFVGLAYLILMICPIAYLLFKVPSFFSNREIYALFFLPYIIFSMGLFYMVLGSRNYKAGDLLAGQLLNICTFPVYLSGAVSALFGFKISFGITQKTKGSAMSYRDLWPQFLMVFLNFIAVIWGINRYYYERTDAILVNGFWALYHAAILSSLFYFNEEDVGRVKCAKLPRSLNFHYQVLSEREDLSRLSKGAWKGSFSASLKEPLEAGTYLMCKMTSKKIQPIMFRGQVLWCSEKKGKSKVKAGIGIVTIPESDQMKLKQMIGK